MKSSFFVMSLAYATVASLTIGAALASGSEADAAKHERGVGAYHSCVSAGEK